MVLVLYLKGLNYFVDNIYMLSIIQNYKNKKIKTKQKREHTKNINKLIDNLKWNVIVDYNDDDIIFRVHNFNMDKIKICGFYDELKYFISKYIINNNLN
jgi:hypothetical protein